MSVPRGGAIRAIVGLWGADAGPPLEPRVLARLLPDASDASAGSAFDSAAIVPAGQTLNPLMGIAENLFLGAERRRTFLGVRLGIDWDLTYAEAGILLAQVGVTAHPTALVRTLSPSDRMRVALAKALASGGRPIVLEEPTGRLPLTDIPSLLELLSRLRDHGTDLVIVTQRIREALEYADSITVLQGGARIAVHRRAEWAEAGGAGPAEMRRRILTELTGGADAAGPTAASERPVPPGHAVAELLRVENWRAFDPLEPDRVVVDGVELVVREGEVVGVAGIAGSGREELLLSVYGRMAGANASGTVSLCGTPVSTATVTDAVSHGLFYLGGRPPRYRFQLVGGLAIPAPVSRVSSFAASGLVAGEDGSRPSDRPRPPGLDILRSGGDDADATVSPEQLAEFARSDRLVLFLGEPTRSPSADERAERRRGIRAIAETGKGVVLASSDWRELLDSCDRVIVLSDGRVAGEVEGGSDPVALVSLLLEH